ncbi:MAG: glutamate ABC transporter substrate-binding protein [Candidatus Gastranaerophilales bacterium]|nr:glutamate ABC transporter substrate-binding protein [Candidatus Gastranaerophilales bacterium]
MFKFNRLAMIFLAIVFMVTGCSKFEKETDVYQNILQRDKIIIGTQFEAKPFGYITPKGALQGADVDIARELAKRLLGSSKKIEFRQVTPANRIQAITTGDVDVVIATMSITPQRKMIVDFSNPYYVAGQAVLVPKNSSISTIKDLNGKKVIVILGTTGEKNLRFFAPSAIAQGYRNYDEAFKAFKAGKGDALTTDDSLLVGFIMDNPNYKILQSRMTQEPYGIAFKNSEDTLALKTNLNRVLNDMNHDGTLSKIKHKWNLPN